MRPEGKSLAALKTIKKMALGNSVSWGTGLERRFWPPKSQMWSVRDSQSHLVHTKLSRVSSSDVSNFLVFPEDWELPQLSVFLEPLVSSDISEVLPVPGSPKTTRRRRRF